MKNINKAIRLGIDFGRVIVQPANEGADTSFLHGSIEDAMETPPYPQVMEVVSRLVDHFSGEVWIVSKAGPRTEKKSRLWLDHHKFWSDTGVSPQNLIFCRKRHEKAKYAKRHQLTHFIDDRIDVLRHLRDIVPNLYLFGEQKEKFQYPLWINRADDWVQIKDYFGFELEASNNG
ncbi:hypothetical protein MNBD_GAMMA12-1076 [hydrothermal vent metagenome]|uniref:Uncharacterized protein n=1 Tax=hydrothermal vent metagenome TaxID=652676 RepID=A0A3B0ZAT9_9ZZZZ